MKREEEDASGPLAVYASNWQVLTIFWATWKQWRKIVLPGGVVREGMDWTQVEAALNLSGIKRSKWPMIFDDLQVAEEAALEYLKRD